MRRLLISVVCLAVAAPTLLAQTVFQPPTFVSAPSGPIFGNSLVTLGDLDGDGDLDGVIGSSFDPLSAVTRVFLNDGAGLLVENGTFPGLVGPSDVELIDMNGDGNLDLVVRNDNFVSLWPGQGDGTFGAFSFFNVQFGPEQVAVGDFDNDGEQDLLVTTFGIIPFGIQPELQIWLGDGNFGFSLENQTSMTGELLDLELADIDEDGNLDAVVILDDLVPRAYFGNGSGLLSTTGTPLTTLSNARGLTLGAVNSDGHLDMVVMSPGLIMDVLLGDGTGAFTVSQTTTLGATFGGFAPALADLNGDGITDMALGHGPSSGAQLEIFLGSGAGQFSSNLVVSADGFPSLGNAVVADMDNDGRVDVLAGVSTGLEIFLNHTYTAADPFVDLGFGFPGTHGYPVQLASGSLVGGTPFAFDLVNGLPGGHATMVVGFSAAHIPFKGGTMVPFPDLLLFGNLMDADGATTIAGTWPTGLPSGASLWLQYWFKDLGAQVNETATSALVLTTP